MIYNYTRNYSSIFGIFHRFVHYLAYHYFSDFVEMGKNKKAPANGFYYFMLEFKQRQGQTHKSMRDVADVAGTHWKNMSTDQKRPYEDKAKRDKHNTKYTSINENIDVLKREDMAKVDRENKMKANIKNTVANNVDLGLLADTSFYLIHINDFFYCRSDKRHYPAEIALLRFNLNYGVLDSNIYHVITQPGRLPLGYAAEAKDRAAESHQLPYPFEDDACNFGEIMENIRQFLKVDFNAAESSCPPMYTCEKDFDKVDNILDFFCDDYGYVREHFKLYETECLLYHLRNREGPIWPSISNAKMELEKDPYNFTCGIGCEVHETSDIGYHCSRSYVVRTAFTICDCVCPDMGIALIPGQHVPANTAETLRQVQTNVSRPPSVASRARYDMRYEDGEASGVDDRGSMKSFATGYSKDKTAYSVASSVYNDFLEYDAEDTIGQSNTEEWSEVANSRQNKRRPKTEWQAQSTQGTPSQGATTSGSQGAVGTLSQVSTIQEPSQGSSAEPDCSYKMRRPTTMSLAQQFKNLRLPPSSGATVGSSSVTKPESITKGRGRGSLIYNLD